jgi:hypothetical protein
MSTEVDVTVKKETEHDRYSKELDAIGKHYAEMLEVGKKVLKWKRGFMATILILFHDVPHQLPCRLLACIGKGCLLVDDCTMLNRLVCGKLVIEF